MKYYLFIFILLSACSPSKEIPKTVKSDTTVKVRAVYRATYSRPVDLIHTKLELTPLWKQRAMKGLATISMKPHFYDQDSVVLNARGMELYEVMLKENGVFKKVDFTYDSAKLVVRLGRKYSSTDTLMVQVRYLAQPEKLKDQGSESIKSDHGLFFIDPDSINSRKPTELWTQGETESNSAWFPTIESPDQKMTQEIFLTVDSAFTTVSNGLLIASTKNSDGTRTDYWKQSLPAAPYLTMIAVGNFAKVSESWNGKEVSYYVDPPYAPYAKMIFGHTPEMLDFFSKILHVTYPWEKYAQIVVHDYISGAMENTTAVIHGTNMQQTGREYVDYNFEDYISHELFHHWFGDLVTCESWSNLTLNEGFANYSEYLWNEYKFGRPYADFKLKSSADTYFRRSERNDPPLINYQYVHRENMYNGITYNKGGRVLHMLRKYVGDQAFFQALHDYLEENKFGSAELANLRMSFEKVVGEDLNWFFNQWFLNIGFPELTIERSWDESTQLATLKVTQTQDLTKYPLFKLPVTVDIYHGNSVERKMITIDSVRQEFSFNAATQPDWINFDAEKMLLCKKNDTQSTQEWMFQYHHGPLYMDRYEALKKLTKEENYGDSAKEVVLAALNDSHFYLRDIAITEIGPIAKNDPPKVKSKLIELATTDSSSEVRETALLALSKYYPFAEMKSVFEKAIHDTSYSVEGTAFTIISQKDASLALQLAPQLEKDSGSAIYEALSNYYKTDLSGRLNFFDRAMDYAKWGDRTAVQRNFETYLANANVDEILPGIKLLTERRRTELNKNSKALYSKTIKNVITRIKTRLDNTEQQIRAGQPESKSEYAKLKDVYERLTSLQ